MQIQVFHRSVPFSQGRRRLFGFMIGALLSISCVGPKSLNSDASENSHANPSKQSHTTDEFLSVDNPEVLQFLEENWSFYRQRFIQGDGRVIDWETDDQRTTSEGQAYAMLRAVLIDDPETFAKVLNWGENNLARLAPNGERKDQLWAWKWGPNSTSQWGILDGNFASDADIDAATALILAARRWARADYLTLAQHKLDDLWRFSTVTVSPTVSSPNDASTNQPSYRRYLLPGPQEAFTATDSNHLYLNPSYAAPYAYRLFAQVQPERDWLALIDSSYHLLENSAPLSELGLPSNWVMLNLSNGQYQKIPAQSVSSLSTQYGFDAYRVWWRVAWDSAWFDDPRAKAYLQNHLSALIQIWRTEQTIPSEIDLQGVPTTPYESTAQYAMLYCALRLIAPAVAQEVHQTKLMPAYRDGFWDSDSAYYTQNLVWLGLFPPEWISAEWLNKS
jgi:endoglucanase